MDFSSEFLTSKNVIIGVNYSAKLIDNAIGLVQQRMDAKKPIVIVHIDQDSDAAKFLEADHGGAQVSAGIQKIADIVADCNREGKYITIKTVDTVLRYSFVSFDSRIWIVAGTNGLGRRKVPGFFVTSPSSWYDHYSDDIMRLIDRAPAP